MATDIPRIHKWWQQPSPNNDYRPPLPPPPPPPPPKKKKKKKTKCWLREIKLGDTSACQILCHLFQVICQQMHAQPPENAVNEQTDRWTDRQTNNNIHKHPWMLSVSHLDTSACQIVGHFFQALCTQYTNPSPWMVGRTDERMKWQQYPSASMLAKGKSSGNICISNSMPFLPSDLSANV